ncbi:hypothetical protein ABT008_15935 [Micromonospora sp. NPDC002389]|uniref:hypothetical protein n=1 Tax=Micromonospora sp. NPDC002389 TaxID=3154272 RepID=UPI0033245483
MIATVPVVISATAQAAPMSDRRRLRRLGCTRPSGILPPRDGWPEASSALRADRLSAARATAVDGRRVSHSVVVAYRSCRTVTGGTGGEVDDD